MTEKLIFDWNGMCSEMTEIWVRRLSMTEKGLLETEIWLE